MSVSKIEGSPYLTDKMNELYYQAMLDLDLANVSQGEKEILAVKLVDMRWEEQE